MKIIDISQEVLSCNVYPGYSFPEPLKLSDMNKGACYNLSAFSMCAHNGTHIDAPCHFINGGKSVEMIAEESFVGYCYVLPHEGIMSAQDALRAIEKAENVGAGERILISGNVTVSEEAAEVFAKKRIKLLGNEGQTVGPKDSPMKVHIILLEAEVVLLEGIILNDVPEGKYFLSAIPLKISGFDGSPCRAYLIKE